MQTENAIKSVFKLIVLADWQSLNDLLIFQVFGTI